MESEAAPVPVPGTHPRDRSTGQPGIPLPAGPAPRPAAPAATPAARAVAVPVAPPAATPGARAAVVAARGTRGRRAPRSPYRSRLKRTTDIVLACLGLLAVAPLLAVTMVLIRLTMGGPALFVQERTGFAGRQFRVVKLRTMRAARPGAPEPTVTRLGRALRKTSVDELPQLWNVVRGEMSLVGPRPLLPRYDPWYAPAERLRFTARPGITGLAQLDGRNTLGWDERLELDTRYVRDWSFRLDLRILARTAWVVLRGAGVVINPCTRLLDLDAFRRQAHALGAPNQARALAARAHLGRSPDAKVVGDAAGSAGPRGA